MSMIGKVLNGRYELVKSIGHGGLSHVYRAIDLRDKGTVAVKVVQPKALSTSMSGRASVAEEQLRDRFEQEVEINRKLSGKSVHLLPFDDSGMEVFEDGVALFLVMPLIEGGRTLDNVLYEYEGKHPTDRKINGGYVPLERALDLLMQAGQGLSAAHAAGVVHRDFKPSNVLVRGEKDKNELAMVMDFGIARYLDAARSSADKKLTQLGCCVGTPFYMSPQQGYGPRPDGDDSRRFDLRNDIWSFGVTMFQVITGRLPFPYDDKPTDEVWSDVYHGTIKPASVSDYCDNVPVELEQLIAKCLEHEVEDRPANMEYILAALQRVRLKLPASDRLNLSLPAASSEARNNDPFAETAFPSSDPPPPRKTPESGPSIEVVKSLVSASAVSASKVSITVKREARPEPPKAAEPEKGGSSKTWLVMAVLGAFAIAAAYYLFLANPAQRPMTTDPSAARQTSAAMPVQSSTGAIEAPVVASNSAKALTLPSAPAKAQPRVPFNTKHVNDPTSAPE